MNGFPGFGDFASSAVFKSCNKDTTAIVVVNDHDIQVASQGDVGIASCEVRVRFFVKWLDEGKTFLGFFWGGDGRINGIRAFCGFGCRNGFVW